MINKELDEKVWINTLNTCHYVRGDYLHDKITTLFCEKHKIEFETNYENVRKNQKPHHVCPLCKKEDKNKNKVLIKCDYCGKEFYRNPNKIKDFNFCCRECKDKAQRVYSGNKFNHLRPKHYSIEPKNYREQAFYYYPHKCAICGRNEDEDILEVHHIDNDRENNDLKNLIILCPICHRKLTSNKYELIERKQIIKK